MDTETQVMTKLSSLVGLRLSIARDAGNMKNFQFGQIRPHPSGKGTVGDFALHVQCPWRFVTNHRQHSQAAHHRIEAAVDAE